MKNGIVKESRRKEDTENKQGNIKKKMIKRVKNICVARIRKGREGR